MVEQTAPHPRVVVIGAGIVGVNVADELVQRGWQQITVTYTPTFVTNKTLTFSLSASDVAKA